MVDLAAFSDLLVTRWPAEREPDWQLEAPARDRGPDPTGGNLCLTEQQLRHTKSDSRPHGHARSGERPRRHAIQGRRKQGGHRCGPTQGVRLASARAAKESTASGGNESSNRRLPCRSSRCQDNLVHNGIDGSYRGLGSVVAW